METGRGGHPRPRAEKVRMEGRPDFGEREPSGEAGGSKKKKRVSFVSVGAVYVKKSNTDF